MKRHTKMYQPDMEDRPCSGYPPSIPQFYADRDVFITGGTGFMGKILIEKLLRSCPNINRIFILVRSKKQKTATERIDDLKKLPVFDQLRISNPDNLKKMIPITGDVCQIGLGLNADDRKIMSNVSIVFHSAASVRFDDPLHEAVIMNTRGTHEVMLFAETLTELKVLVHVSTTYSNPSIREIDEKIYPPNANWRTTIKLAEDHPEVLDQLTLKYTNYDANTYTFTKGLGEQVAHDFRHRLPIIVFRPSIVISALEEPIPGWVDNFNGPVGLLLACGIGILHTTYGDPDIVSDFIPVDTSIRAMIVAAWQRSVYETKESILVYNCSTSLQRAFTTGFIIKMGEDIASSIPFDTMLWKPGGYITKCKYNNFIKFILFHLCTAYLVDAVFKIAGRKVFLVKLQRRIYAANLALSLFIRTTWTFYNAKLLSLHDHIQPADFPTFRYDNFSTVDIREYFQHCILGARRYLMKEKDENIPRAQRNYRRLWWLDAAVRFIFVTITSYVVISRLGIFD